MYYKLQALRGLAACILVFYKSPFDVLEHKLGFMMNAYLFVDLFFVLSGFVLSHAYAKAIEEGMSFKRYMLLRAGRVYPLHIFMLVMFAAYEVLRLVLLNGDANETRTLGSIVSNVFLLQSMGLHNVLTWNTPSWSISVEFYCYIVFFVLLKVFDNRARVITPLVIAIGCYVAIVLLGKKTLNVTYDYGFLRCVAGFYVGVFVYRIKDFLPRLVGFSHNISVVEIAAIVFVGVVVGFSNINFVVQLLAIVGFASLIYVFSFEKHGVLGRLFMTRPLQLIGEWSYSIYMVHMLIWTLVNVLTLKILKMNVDEIHGVMAVGINVGVLFTSIVCSMVTYHFVEKMPRDWIKKKLSPVA